MTDQPARRVRTDRERAEEELDVYAGRLRRTHSAMLAAREAMIDAETEFGDQLRIYEHLRRHPAFGDEQPPRVEFLDELDLDDDAVSLGEPVERAKDGQECPRCGSRPNARTLDCPACAPLLPQSAEELDDFGTDGTA